MIEKFLLFRYDGSTDSFVSWILAVAASSNPPLVHSISYLKILSKSLAIQFDTEAMKLGIQGVSIFVSSGDDGVAGYSAEKNSTQCSYNPYYPASSNYVTTVGATQGPESGNPEIVCSSNSSGVITSGGGFSTIYKAKLFQKLAIDKYFATINPKPQTGYNETGRGYPDISLLGYNYEVIAGGNTYALSGTSASTPVFAGLVSLVNAARLKAGKSSLGYINPIIYFKHAEFVRDITIGNNLCTAGKLFLLLIRKKETFSLFIIHFSL